MQRSGKNINKKVAGTHTLHDITSENGEKLMQLATVHNLEVVALNFNTEESIRVPGNLQPNTSYTHKQKKSIYDY